MYYTRAHKLYYTRVCKQFILFLFKLTFLKSVRLIISYTHTHTYRYITWRSIFEDDCILFGLLSIWISCLHDEVWSCVGWVFTDMHKKFFIPSDPVHFDLIFYVALWFRCHGNHPWYYIYSGHHFSLICKFVIDGHADIDLHIHNANISQHNANYWWLAILNIILLPLIVGERSLQIPSSHRRWFGSIFY